MPELRTITCDVPRCKARVTENGHGAGFKDWGQLSGIALNGVPNPYLCPDHLAKVADFVDTLIAGG